jgi:hypothetical protein
MTETKNERANHKGHGVAGAVVTELPPDKERVGVRE